MNVSFQDLQHQDNPRNGDKLGDEQSVLALLDELVDTTSPYMCQFIGDNGFSMTVGIGRDSGCVQHAPNDGSPPYLMATASRTNADHHEMTFLVGDVPTPIHGRYFVPFELVKTIVAQFVASGERSEEVAWREFEASD